MGLDEIFRSEAAKTPYLPNSRQLDSLLIYEDSRRRQQNSYLSKISKEFFSKDVLLYFLILGSNSFIWKDNNKAKLLGWRK